MGLFGLFGPPNIQKMADNGDINGIIEYLRYKRDPAIPKQAEQTLLQIGDSVGMSNLAKKILIAGMKDSTSLPLLTKMGSPALKPLITFIVYLNLLPTIRGWDNIDPRGSQVSTKDHIYYWNLNVKIRYNTYLRFFSSYVSINALIFSLYDEVIPLGGIDDLILMGKPAQKRINEIMAAPDFKAAYKSTLVEMLVNMDTVFFNELIDGTVVPLHIQKYGADAIEKDIWKNVLYRPYEKNDVVRTMMIERYNPCNTVKGKFEHILKPNSDWWGLNPDYFRCDITDLKKTLSILQKAGIQTRIENNYVEVPKSKWSEAREYLINNC